MWVQKKKRRISFQVDYPYSSMTAGLQTITIFDFTVQFQWRRKKNCHSEKENAALNRNERAYSWINV